MIVAVGFGTPVLLLALSAFWLSTPHVQFGSQPASSYIDGHVFVTGFVVNVGGQDAVASVVNATVASQEGNRIGQARAEFGDISPQAQVPFYLKIAITTSTSSVLLVQSSISWTEGRPFLGPKSFSTSLTTLRVEKFDVPPLDHNTLGMAVDLAIPPAAKILTGPNTDAIAYGLGYVWATNTRGNSITRVDPSDNAIHLITVGNEPSAVAVGFGSIWVGSATNRMVWRLDPATEHVATIQIGGYASSLATSEQGVWVGTTGGKVQKIDPSTNRVVGTAQIGVEGSRDVLQCDDVAACTFVATGQGSIWVSVYGEGVVARVDAVTLTVLVRVPVGDHPWHLAVQGESVWVPNISSVIRIDQATNRVASTTAGGLGASSVAVDGDSLWITSTTVPFIFKADMRTGRPVGYVELDTGSTQAVVGGDSLWVLHGGGPGIPPSETVPSTIDRLKIA